MSTLQAVPDRSQTLTDRVASEVRAQMARIRMTQTALAAVLGLPQSAVSNRLRGKVAFSIDELEKVSAALGVHPAALLGGNGPSPTPGSTLRSYHGLTTVRDGNLILLSGNGDDGDEPGAMRTTRTAAAA